MDKKTEIKKIYSLSPMQEGMLFNALLKEDTNTYFEQISFTLDGNLDIVSFEKSFNHLVDRHDILRTVFLYEKLKQPKQVVLKERKVRIHFEDISQQEKYEQKKHIDNFKKSEREKGFNISKDVLIRISVFKTNINSFNVILSFHHILLDGWCLGIIFKELFQVYECIVNAKPVNLPIVRPYSDYIKWQEEQDKDEAYAFWKEYLAEYENEAVIPNYCVRASGLKYKREEIEFKFSETLTENLVKIAKLNQVTLNTVIKTIWGILLQRYNNTDDVVYGSVVSGRTPEIAGIENMVGLFINTIPIRIIKKGDETFSEMIKSVQLSTMTTEKYEYVPLAKIQACSQLKSKLFNHIIAFENYPIEEQVSSINSGGSFFGFSVRNLDVFEQTSYGFNITVIPGRIISIKISFNANVYDRLFVGGICKHFQNVAKKVVENPDIDISQIDILTKEESDQILFEFNQTSSDYPQDKTVMDFFEKKAAEIPDEIALVFNNDSLTYGELNKKANQVARFLRSKGIVSNSIVGIMAERSCEMIIAIFGVLKAGGAYLPVDPGYPVDRINFLLNDSNACILLTNLNGNVCENISKNVVNLNEEAILHESTENLKNINKPEDLAYIIYTSGSTGKPKGVTIEHKSAVNLLLTLQKMYPLTENDSFLLKTTYTFDVSVAEIFGWFFGGGRLIILQTGAEKEPRKIIEAIDIHKVTHINFVPSMLNVFINGLSNKEIEIVRKLKYVFAAGEALSKETARKFYSLFGRVKLENLYGPTEATVYATGFSVENYENGLSIPIGKPLQNTKVFIVDKNNNLQPVGVAGELCIGGDGLARGYLNSMELTSLKFIPNPFFTGGRIYKSGDLARMLPDGNIEYMGRIDQQVKIRGYRIELGEIENAIQRHNDVNEAVVVARDDSNGSKQLCAYVVPNNIDTAALKMCLSKELPDYMIPSIIIPLDTLPLTSSGKIDRKSLPHPSGSGKDGTVKTLPRFEEEKQLIAIWEEVLGVKNISIKDDFFNLGGDSLSIIRVLSASAAYNWRLSIQDFYKFKTIEELVARIKGTVVTDVENDAEITDIVSRNDKTDINSIFISRRTNEFKRVLLTGATGFLGAHVLFELLEKTGNEVYCLVRGNNHHDAQEKLKRILKFYFGDRYDCLIGERVQIICGDISSENFGLLDDHYSDIKRNIDTVFHTAALVKHYGEYEDFKKVNVNGTYEIIKFVQNSGKRLFYISTMSISGDHMEQRFGERNFCEDDFYIGQDYSSNVYLRSKFEAENLVFKAINSGLNATILRVGNLTGRTGDGQFQINISENKFYNILKSFMQLKAVPECLLSKKIEFTPIDKCSEAIVGLARLIESEKKVFHIFNHNLVEMGWVINALNGFGAGIKLTNDSDFKQYIDVISTNPDKNKILDGIIDVLSNGKDLAIKPSVHVRSEITQKYLHAFGFDWPIIDTTYIDKIYKYMIKIGYVEVIR